MCSYVSWEFATETRRRYAAGPARGGAHLLFLILLHHNRGVPQIEVYESDSLFPLGNSLAGHRILEAGKKLP
jgi:hypothetical protein